MPDARVRRLETAVLAFAALVGVSAQANPYSDFDGTFTASYSNVSSTYLVAGVARDMTHQRFGIDYSEMGNDWFYAGVSAGLAFLDGGSEPLITETSLPGYLFGVFGGARYRMLEGKLALTLEASALKEWESGEISGSGGDQTTVRFSDVGVRLGASYRFETVQLSAGGYTSNAFGHIERTGAVTGVADLSESESNGAYAGLEILLDSGYAFGMRYESGARETVALTFSSSF